MSPVTTPEPLTDEQVAELVTLDETWHPTSHSGWDYGDELAHLSKEARGYLDTVTSALPSLLAEVRASRSAPGPGEVVGALRRALDDALRNGPHSDHCPAQPNVCTCWRSRARAALSRATTATTERDAAIAATYAEATKHARGLAGRVAGLLGTPKARLLTDLREHAQAALDLFQCADEEKARATPCPATTEGTNQP
jgi:hypothetical protein